MKISIKDFKRIIQECLRRKYDKVSAKMMMEVMLFGELAGRPSHGIVRLLPGHYGPLDENPLRLPQIKKRTKVSAFIEGNGNPGMLITSIATNEAIKLAKKSGVAIVVARGNNSSSGCLSYYVEKIAKKGLIGIIAAKCYPMVAPFNSREPLFGTNPLAFGFPSKPEPILFDMATSGISFGDVAVAKLSKQKIAPNKAIDRYGKPTQDPSKALDGALLPFDLSPKASGLGMVIELLAGVLPNANFCGNNSTVGFGNTVIVISPKLFLSSHLFSKNSARLVKAIKTSKSRDGKKIRITGENTIRIKNLNLKKGKISIDEKVFRQIQKGFPDK